MIFSKFFFKTLNQKFVKTRFNHGNQLMFHSCVLITLMNTSMETKLNSNIFLLKNKIVKLQNSRVFMRINGRKRSNYLKMKKMIQELDVPSTNPSKFLRGRENF